MTDRRKRTTPGSDPAPTNVVRFPPLPRIPTPPRLPPDPRQARTQKTVGALVRLAAPTMHLAGPNFVTGFHASAVDLGRLQSALARGVARLTDVQIAERWDEVMPWMLRVLRGWVQRYKHAKIVRCGGGIRVEIETQDDYGYYTYGFDVFPGQPAPSRKRRA